MQEHNGQASNADQPAASQDPGTAKAKIRPIKVSIRTKMILLSTLLLVGAIAAFGVVNARQSRRSIGEYSERLRREITESLSRSGRAQLQLLGAAARIALLQSDYESLKTIVADAQKEDSRITKVAVIGPDGGAIARVGGEFTAEMLAELGKLDGPKIIPNLAIGGEPSMVFATPVKYRQSVLCTALIAYTLKPLQQELAKAEETKRQVAAANLRNIVLFGLLAAIVGTLLTIVQGLRISRPISALAAQAQRVADGEFGAQVDIRSYDEIGRLGDTFNHMSSQIVSLMDQAREKAALTREFEIANSIQSSLVPSSSATSLCGLEISGFFQPASQCGGDWWNYYELSGSQALIVIGDVTGHGVPAAMITALVKGAASTMVSVSNSRFDLNRFLGQLNAMVYESGGRTFFMTCFVGLYDAERKTLTYANAGHTQPYHYRAAEKQITSLMSRGTWLGYNAEQSFETKSTDVGRGDVFVMYTDGVTELENSAGGLYGDQRFRRALLKHLSLPLGEFQDRVIADAYKFAGGVPQGDDVTLVVGRVT